MDVFVSGVGMTRFGRVNESLEEIMAKAAAVALKDAGRESIDAINIGGLGNNNIV